MDYKFGYEVEELDIKIFKKTYKKTIKIKIRNKTSRTF